MKFTKELVNDYANKLLIGLTDEENKSVLDEFDIIEENMNLITEIPNIESVSPMTHTLDDFSYELTSDEEEESITVPELMQNCDDYDGLLVVVPKVVG